MTSRSAKIVFFVALAASAAPLFSHAAVQINTNIPGTHPNDTACGIIANLYEFAIGVAGLLALGAIAYGGIKYLMSPGNPSKQSEGKQWIYGALEGLLLLLLAYLILYTVNPNLVNLNCQPLAAIPPPTTPPPSPGGALCDDLPKLAASNNEPYPPATAPDIITLMSCLRAHVSFSAATFTYDNDHPTCNYTRGFPLCDSSCSHARYSCHYGGHAGSQGAEAVDIDVIGTLGQQVVDAAYNYCGIPRGGKPKARCEAAHGVRVPCVGGGATHVHVSSASCDAN